MTAQNLTPDDFESRNAFQRINRENGFAKNRGDGNCTGFRMPHGSEMSRRQVTLFKRAPTACGFMLKSQRWILVALLLSSCNQGSLNLSDIASTELPTQPQNPSGWIAEPRKQEWWTALNDKQLDAIVSRVQQSNLTLAQARERRAAASAMERSASSTYLPNVAFSGSAIGSTGKMKIDDIARRPAQISLETGWEIALFGQNELTQKAAALEGNMAAEDVEAAKLSVTAEAAISYVRLRALQEQRSTLDGLSSAYAKSKNIAAVRSKSGLGTSLETQVATDESRAIEIQKDALDSAIANEIQRIAILQGSQDGDGALAAKASQPISTRAFVAQIPAEVLRQRPDVRRAEWNILKAGTDVGLATADLYPKLHLSGIIGFGSPVSGSLFGVMGGPSLQVPIFDYGKRRDIVEARKAQMREAISAYHHAILIAHSEASSALRALCLARQETLRANAAHATAKKSVAAAELLARQGLSDQSHLAARQIHAVETKRLLIEAIKDEAEALVALARATGGNLTSATQGATNKSDPQRKSRS